MKGWILLAAEPDIIVDMVPVQMVEDHRTIGIPPLPRRTQAADLGLICLCCLQCTTAILAIAERVRVRARVRARARARVKVRVKARAKEKVATAIQKTVAVDLLEVSQ